MSKQEPRIAGAANFRDLAAAIRSRPLARGRLFRSDHLGALDADDARQVRAMGVKRVLDFRGTDERVSAVCAVDGVQVHSLSIEPTIVQVIHDLMRSGHELTSDEVVAHMQDTYRGFVRRSSDRYAEFFAHLLASNEPTVFHCTAGKDRTGFAAALVLHALDVPHDEVMHDYLLTNERVQATPLKPGLLPAQVTRVLFRVQPEFLHAAFEAIEADYGNVQTYLRKALGVGERERERLRTLYLDRALR